MGKVLLRIRHKLLKPPLSLDVAGEQLVRFHLDNAIHGFDFADVPQRQRVQRRIARADDQPLMARGEEAFAKGVFNERPQQPEEQEGDGEAEPSEDGSRQPPVQVAESQKPHVGTSKAALGGLGQTSAWYAKRWKSSW